METKFNCWSCGACCKMCNLVEELKHLDSGNGVCVNLKEDNTCAIYETRPDVCRTRKMYDDRYKEKVTWDEYVRLSEYVCKWLEKKFKNDNN